MYTEPDRSINKFLVAVIVVLLAVGVYLYLDRDRVGKWFARDLIKKEKSDLEEKIDSLQEEVATLKEKIKEQEQPLPSEGKIAEVFGGQPATVPEQDEDRKVQEPSVEVVCKDLQEKLRSFCAYLDRQDYVAAYGIEEGTYQHFRNLVPRLLKTPPAVVRETDDLLRVLQNNAHFFRVMGKENTLLCRDILKNDGGMMETLFDLLYRSMVTGRQCKEKGVNLELQFPVQDVYEYAVFFLNTLGGRSYLMRRDSRVRMLTQYYSILVLDLANGRHLNRLGMDIRYPLQALITDIKGASNLERKGEYLRTLTALENKYQKLYGG